MEYDTLGREKVGQNNITRGLEVRLLPHDMIVFRTLHDHGALPTKTLFQFVSRVVRNYEAFVRRLKQLRRAGYLYCPGTQKDTYLGHCNQLVHGLRDKAIDLLKEEGSWSPHIVSMSDGIWQHDTLVHCVSANIALKAKEHGIKFIPQQEILDKTGNGLRVKDVNGHDLIPDGIFALQYPNGKYRAFCIEADRCTERLRSGTDDIKTFQRNVRQYREFIGVGKKKWYQEHFGLKAGMFLLTVTGGAQRMKTMMEIVAEECPSGSNSYMLFQANEYFRSDGFRPPELIPELFDNEWHRIGHSPIHISGQRVAT